MCIRDSIDPGPAGDKMLSFVQESDMFQKNFMLFRKVQRANEWLYQVLIIPLRSLAKWNLKTRGVHVSVRPSVANRFT